MAKFIMIQSNININVTAGLQNVNASKKVIDKEGNLVPERLNVNPLWTDLMVFIKKGPGYYPAEIKNWPTVKALCESNQITLGAECDTCPDQDKVEAIKAKLKEAAKHYAEEVAKYEPKEKSAQ